MADKLEFSDWGFKNYDQYAQCCYGKSGKYKKKKINLSGEMDPLRKKTQQMLEMKAM